MSLVDRHEIGMLSSVMRALKHMEAHALRGQRPSWRSSAATPTATPRPLSALSPSARPLVTGLAALALTLAPSTIGPSVARADAICTRTGRITNCIFSFTGAAETYTLPVYVNSITVSLTGASGGTGGQFTTGLGGSGVGGSGGLGAAVTGTVAVAGRTVPDRVRGRPLGHERW